MSIQSAVDALAPIAEFAFFAVAMLPYVLMAALGLGCAFAIAAVCLKGHKASNEQQVKNDDQS
ncbi:hypothetical protein [Burkholderia glumae]|uniref:hypothetical protein n=1 Tax=Burkholderia glumae TaxID=337 RepID=UPI002150F279|nr:hypothetical protein [Burkholderia glumae]